MRGAGFLAIWSDVEPQDLTDYRHWLTREHTTERVTTKGFLASRVFRADAGRHQSLLHPVRAGIARGARRAAYLARLNAPTPWSQRIMPQLGNFMRGGGIMAARAGRGEGATIVALRIEHLPENPQRLAGDAGCTATGSPPCRSARPTMRGLRCRRSKRACDRMKGFFAGLLIIEALDEASLRRRLASGGARSRPSPSAGSSEPEIYQGMFALDARIADFG